MNVQGFTLLFLHWPSHLSYSTLIHELTTIFVLLCMPVWIMKFKYQYPSMSLLLQPGSCPWALTGGASNLLLKQAMKRWNPHWRGIGTSDEQWSITWAFEWNTKQWNGNVNDKEEKKKRLVSLLISFMPCLMLLWLVNISTAQYQVKLL